MAQCRLRLWLAWLYRGQAGISMITSVGTLTVITIAGTTIIAMTTANERQARVSESTINTSALADAGLNEALAVLANPGNNPFNPALLAARTSIYATGSVTWSGTLDATTSTWAVTSRGRVRNPTGAADLFRTVTAQVPVTVPANGPLENPAWNYIYASVTGGACDMTIQQSVQVASPLYVRGNLCFQNTASVTSGPLDVLGRLTLYQNANRVGSVTSPVNEAHIKGGCIWKANPLHSPCSGTDNVFAVALDSNPPEIAVPSADLENWYVNASPGPYSPCANATGTPPTFDNDQGPLTNPDPTRRNNSVSLAFNLTPSLSYSCKTAGGELSWDANTRRLNVKGTVYIDGSARIDNGFVNTYDGQATLYLSGTLLARSSELCAVVTADGSNCTASGWNPNSRMLVVAAEGTAGQVPGGDSVQLLSSTFEGALYGTGAIEVDTTSQVIGPVIGSTVILGQSVTTSFPTIAIVPAGAPGQTFVPPTVGPVRNYGG
jgi:hypothetical protein